MFGFERSNTLRRRRKLRECAPKEPKAGDQYEEKMHYGVCMMISAIAELGRIQANKEENESVYTRCVDFLRLLP